MGGARPDSLGSPGVCGNETGQQLGAHAGGVWEAWAESRGLGEHLVSPPLTSFQGHPPNPPSGLSRTLWPPGGAP